MTRRTHLGALTGCVVALGLAAPAAAQDPGGRGRGQQGEGEGQQRRRGPPFADPNWSNDAVEMLKAELDLDPGQVVEVKKALDEGMRAAMQQAAELWNPDQGFQLPDQNRMREVFEKARVDIAKRIDAVLTPAQRREFEALVDQFDRRSQEFAQRRQAWEDPTALFDPAPISRRVLLDKAERSLFLGPDETQVIMPFVARVVDLRIALNEGRKVRRDDLRNAIEGGASAKEVDQRVDEIRAAAEFQRLELAAAEQALRELLTVEQEVRLVAMGVLE